MDPFPLADIAGRLRAERFGRPLVYAPRLTSTQTLAAHLAARAWPEGTIVLAEEQTAGRGRQGRAWFAPWGQALLVSAVLRPNLASARASQLTMLAALAAAEAIEDICSLPIFLKWPNDLYLRGRKLGGILTEAQLAADGTRMEVAIVGIGINVTVDFTAQPALQETATSLHREAERPPARADLLLELLPRLEARYREVIAGGSCHSAWSQRLLWIGEPIHVVSAQGVVRGVARGVDDQGALLVERDDGVIEAVWAGDVIPAD